MKTKDLVEQLVRILPPEEYKYSVQKRYLLVEKLEKGFELNYGRMYDPPQISFSNLKSLSELFGTDEIDVDNYSQGGCETCDYGSDYGHTIQIKNPTKFTEEMESLVGKDLFKEEG